MLSSCFNFIRGLRGAALSLMWILGMASATGAERPPFTIEPGPSSMTAEEKALQPDPSKGAQHAIILLDDTLRDDSIGQRGRHIRMKVLSGRWRGVGDIEIPYEARRSLKQWWTQIIPPEGPAIQIGKSSLIPHVVARRGGAKLRVLKVALPRVMAGSIIDLGYVLQSGGSAYVKINLQQPWPVQRLRYFWAPTLRIPSQYHILRRPGLKISVSREKESVFLEATDLPPFVEERWAPPDDLTRAAAVFHYTFDEPNADPNVFWDDVARQYEEGVSEFLKEDAALREIMKTLDAPSGLTLDGKLRAAYEWIQNNVRNTGNLTAEDAEALKAQRELQTEKEKRSAYAYHRKPGTLKDILEHHEADGNSLDRLFLGMARKLGAQAHLTLATDRQSEFWDRTLLTRYQFSTMLVAVRAPGDPLDKAVFVDPGYGLPYGVVDWRFTVSRAMVATPQGAREATIRYQGAERNEMITRAQINFDPATSAAKVTWSASGSGLRGREERLDMRASLPEERERNMRRICGEGASMEVFSAESPGWQEPAGAFALKCGADLAELGPSSSQSSYSVSFSGPWIPDVPAPVSPERFHPIVFPYPRVDNTEIHVEGPQGFVPDHVPSAVKLVSPFGEYVLVVQQTDRGFEVKRRLTITTVTARAEQYDGLRRFFQDVRRADDLALRFHRAEAGS